MVFYLTLDLKHVKKTLKKLNYYYYYFFIFPLKEAALLVGIKHVHKNDKLYCSNDTGFVVEANQN